MQSFKTTTVFFIVLGVILSVTSSALAQKQTVTIQPEKPQQGETVTITYHPDSPDAKITSPDSLKLVLSYAPYLYSIPDEFEMNKTENGWATGFELSENFAFATFYFKSGEKTDKNAEGHEYEFFAYENGLPVKDTYLMAVSRVDNRYEEASEMKKNEIKAHLYAKALAVHPEYYEAQMKWYAFLLAQEYVDSVKVQAMAHHAIQQKLAENPGSWNTIRLVKYGYRQIDEKAMADSVEKAMIEKYPNSDIAMYDLYQKATDEEDGAKKAKMLTKYVNADYERSFINKLYTENALEQLYTYYAEQGNVAMMKKYLNRYLQPSEATLDKIIKSKFYKEAARTIAENTKKYELALEYAQKAYELTNNEPVSVYTTLNGRKVAYQTKKETDERLTGRNSEILATLGFIYTKMENYDKAAEKLLAAKKLSDDESILKDLANLYVVTDQPEKAYSIYRDLLLKKPFNEELRSQLKESYIAYRGSEEGFETEIEQVVSEWRVETIAEFKEEMLDKEPPALASITDLQGNPLDLTTLENKVVVIDFWATWCGPCLKAFPYVQNVYEKYKDNENVKFIILNSAWSNSIEDAVKWTKEGEYAENEYTFPLYYDKDSKVTTAIGVTGIPTTFILGKDGNIKFKHVGYYGPLMEQKLALRIEMLLSDEPIAVVNGE